MVAAIISDVHGNADTLAAIAVGGVRVTAFTVNSDLQITSVVPTGAKTGKVAVSTPGGTAISSQTFTVTP